MVRYHLINGESVQFTAEEEAQRDAEEKAYADKSAERKLNTIKMIRLTKLQETDFYALKDVTMTDEMKTWRQSLRDIPANHTNKYYYWTIC